MKKPFLFFFGFFFLTINNAFADITISISDIEENKMRVTYTYVANKAGKKALDFPGHFFDFAKGPINVISAKEINTNQKLEYHIFKSTKSTSTGRFRESVKVDYPYPIPEGKKFKLEVTVEAITDNISCESEGRYIVTYETDQELFFIVPEGYAIIYTNVPVLIDERNKNVILQVKKISEDYKTQNILFKIQAFPKEVTEESDSTMLTEKPVTESNIPVTLSRYISKGNTSIENSISQKRPSSYPYSLKLGAFRTLERVQKAMNLYRDRDLCPYWIKVDLKEKGEWYRIYSGHFENYEQAEKFKQEHELTESIISKKPYANLIGTFISLDELEIETISLENKGYSPYIIEDPKGLFRLFVGVFSTLDEAYEQCSDMKSQNINCHIVNR